MSKPAEKRYYDLLQIMKDATEKDIKKAYKKAALEHHPDKGGSDDMFQKISEAYQFLSDPSQR